MIITITKVEELKTRSGEKDYLKVTGIDGKTQKETTKIVFDNLSEKWHLIQEGSTLEFKMNQVYKDGKANWNVIDINPIADKLPPQEPKMLPEHEREIDKAKDMIKPEPPAPQAVGMTTKELGDMIRAGKLNELFGPEAALELVKWYRSQILGVTRIAFDGAKLPQFKKKETA